MHSSDRSGRFLAKAAARAPRRVASVEAGFSLIEVLATALVTILLSLGVATALIAQTHSSGDQQLRSQANTLVNQDQDRLRGMSDEALSNLASNGSATATQTVGNETFTITSSASYQDALGNSSCKSSSVDYFKINSQVSWTEAFAGNSTQTVSADGLLARPVTGQLETLVTDQTGAGLPGVSVTATPPSGSSASTQSGVTDSTGCSVFAGLGVTNSTTSYTVTAAKSGWVTPQNLPTASTTAAITNTGSTATAAFTLGQAGSVTANFQAASPSAAGQADGVMYSGTGPGYSTVTGQGTTSTLPAATQTASSLFPFESTAGSPVYTNNYSLYAGQCAFQSPPSANLSSATVTPGGSATATVKEPSLDIKAVQATLVTTYNLQPSDIVLTYSSGGCVDSYKATVATPASGSGLNATAPSTGWLASPGQPYAASASVLTVCADYTLASGVIAGLSAGTYSGSVMTTNSSFTSVNPNTSGLTIPLTTLGACSVQ